jgi:hypothetical protein
VCAQASRGFHCWIKCAICALGHDGHQGTICTLGWSGSPRFASGGSGIWPAARRFACLGICYLLTDWGREALWDGQVGVEMCAQRRD